MTEPDSCLNRGKRNPEDTSGKLELVDYIAGLNFCEKFLLERHFTELISDIGRFSQIVTQ